MAGLAYPDVLAALAATSPLHFFGGGFVPSGRFGVGRVCPDLAALLLALQCYTLGFRGQVIGEGLIARDRQRGIWGFLLLTPLTAGEIFWGKVWGQSAPAGAVWAGCGLGGLLLYALTRSPPSAWSPRSAAWLVGQTFVAALFVLGLAIGAALSTYPVFFKNLRGAADAAVRRSPSGWASGRSSRWLPFDLAASGVRRRAGACCRPGCCWGSGTRRLLSIPLLVFAQWRVAAVRRGDVAAGDGAG